MKFLQQMNNSDSLYRFLDIFLAIFFLCIFSPIIILAAFCIKIGNLRAPVFADNHWRVGKNGRLFFMYKFRTMIPNAKELLEKDPKFAKLKKKYDLGGAKLKINEDFRITRVGKIVKRFDIDELPQFFNVLKGDMSIVGPRAFFAEEITLYSHRYPSFKKKIKGVLKLQPGITGLWQISGRNMLTIAQRVDYDYEYVKKKSILLYILILLKTPIVVLTRYGVYE